jgi:hypothetical protein
VEEGGNGSVGNKRLKRLVNGSLPDAKSSQISVSLSLVVELEDYNSLTGSIPTEVGRLTGLRILFLGKTPLTI